MVGSTRGTLGGFQASGSGEPPPPPPPPNLAEVLAAQTELFRQIVQGQQLLQQQQQEEYSTINLKLQGIGISWELSPLCST